MLNEKEKKFAKDLAKKSIEYYFKNKKTLKIDEIKYLSLKEKRGVFVTLTIHNNLRGCIGSFHPEEIYKAIIKNSVNAAFHDPRFPRLTEEEFNKIEIEISILSELKELEFKDKNDLFNKVAHNHGVLIKFGNRTATFLPQVWEMLPDKEAFFVHLCLKAGLDSSILNKKGLKVYLYEIEKIK